jgi:hypothetical protein
MCSSVSPRLAAGQSPGVCNRPVLILPDITVEATLLALNLMVESSKNVRGRGGGEGDLARALGILS